MSDHMHDQRDQKQQDAIIAPGHTLATITDKISEIVLTPPLKTPLGWHAMMGIGSIGMLLLGATVTKLVFTGIGIWGNNVPVGWALALPPP